MIYLFFFLRRFRLQYGHVSITLWLQKKNTLHTLQNQDSVGEGFPSVSLWTLSFAATLTPVWSLHAGLFERLCCDCAQGTLWWLAVSVKTRSPRRSWNTRHAGNTRRPSHAITAIVAICRLPGLTWEIKEVSVWCSFDREANSQQ